MSFELNEEEKRLLGEDGHPIDENVDESVLDEEMSEPGDNGEAAKSANPSDPLGLNEDMRLLLQQAAHPPVEKRSTTQMDRVLGQLRETESNLRLMTDECSKMRRERDEYAAKVDELNRNRLANEKQAKLASAKREAARDAVDASWRCEDLSAAREHRKAREPGDQRIIVDAGTPLHPDFSCGPCGKRALRVLFPEMFKAGNVYNTQFSTMREAGALLDMEAEGGQYSLWEAKLEMKRRAESKEVSSKNLKIAYRKGMCEHIVEAAEGVSMNGVSFDDEDPSVGEAVTSVVASGSARVTKRGSCVIIPSDSVVWKASGDERDTEFVKYGDETEMKKTLQTWEKARNFPQSLFVVLKSSFAESVLMDLRSVFEEIVKKMDVTVYVAGDVLPLEASALKKDAVCAQQAWLTHWRLDKPRVNLIVISSVSGLLSKIHPFVCVYKVARKESKLLFERAVKEIMFGEAVDLDYKEEKKSAPVKRRSEWDDPSTSGGRAEERSKKPRMSNITCYNCQEKGHTSYSCKNPKQERPQHDHDE